MFTPFCKNVIVPTLLRLALAAIFIFHGLDLVGGEGNEMGARWMKSEGAPPVPVQLAVAWGQLIGGIAMALGFLTRLAAVGLIAVMIGAIAQVHSTGRTASTCATEATSTISLLSSWPCVWCWAVPARSPWIASSASAAGL